MAMFFGGVPTKLDVDKLMADLDPQPGMRITYLEIEAVIGLDHKENRFGTVTNSWRKRLFREKLLQTTRDGEAFNFLTADEAQDYGIKSMWKIGRAAGRTHIRTKAINANELSSDQRRAKIALQLRETQALVEASQKSVKAIAAPKAVMSVVRTAAK